MGNYAVKIHSFEDLESYQSYLYSRRDKQDVEPEFSESDQMIPADINKLTISVKSEEAESESKKKFKKAVNTVMANNKIAHSIDNLVPSRYRIRSIESVKSINKIPVCQIVFLDGDNEVSGTGKNEPWFDIGRIIKIDAELHDARLSFSGLVVETEVKLDENEQIFIVTIKHFVSALDANIRSVVHTATAKENLLPLWQRFQNYCSDWDYLIGQADLFQCWVVTDGDRPALLKSLQGELHLSNKLDEEVVLVEPNDNLIFGSLSYTDEESKQLADKVVKGEHIVSREGANANDTVISIVSRQCSKGLYGEVQVATIEHKARFESETNKLLSNMGRQQLTMYVPHMSKDAARIANAKQWRGEQAKLRGHIRYQNHSLIDDGVIGLEDKNAVYLGQKIKGLSGILDIEDEDLRISSISHELSEKGWFVEVGWGMEPEFHVEKHLDAKSLPAFGLTPGTNGIQIGIVAADSNNNHPTVKVKIFDNIEMTVKKARVNDRTDNRLSRMTSTFDGLNDRIAKGLPWLFCAKGDKVIIAFANDNPNEAIVIGKLVATDETDKLPPLRKV